MVQVTHGEAIQQFDPHPPVTAARPTSGTRNKYARRPRCINRTAELLLESCNGLVEMPSFLLPRESWHTLHVEGLRTCPAFHNGDWPAHLAACLSSRLLRVGRGRCGPVQRIGRRRLHRAKWGLHPAWRRIGSEDVAVLGSGSTPVHEVVLLKLVLEDETLLQRQAAGLRWAPDLPVERLATHLTWDIDTGCDLQLAPASVQWDLDAGERVGGGPRTPKREGQPGRPVHFSASNSCSMHSHSSCAELQTNESAAG